MFGRDKNTQQTDVVAALRKQVQDAKALSAIPDQKLLADPRLNPATRGQADELTAARLSEKLALEHKRELRRAREEDRREEREARRQAAIDAARDATDPATTVLDLTTSRKRYVAGALVASVVCSVGSAMGVEAYAQTMGPRPAWATP
ncbi:MAG: hypothetical protein M0026_01865, partial [Nocardiopsaceae bacterium]|nr:hypothetical protein [Nocardiopsaceae bacterium]